MTLLGKLLMVQIAHGWTDRQMAGQVGVKLRMWQLIKAGSCGFSRRSLSAVVRNFPGLHDDVIAYLATDTEPEKVAA